jgi:hypothetical protein
LKAVKPAFLFSLEKRLVICPRLPSTIWPWVCCFPTISGFHHNVS